MPLLGPPTNIWYSIESTNDPCAETLAGPMGQSDIIGSYLPGDILRFLLRAKYGLQDTILDIF